jgi:hypothetical protein
MTNIVRDRTDKMTLQEAAIAAGFEDFMLEPGGGIRVWDSACVVGIVLSEAVVREHARINAEKRVAWPEN